MPDFSFDSENKRLDLKTYENEVFGFILRLRFCMAFKKPLS